MDEAGDRLFPIQNDGHDFFTGVCSDGRQVVMGLLCPALVAYFFDLEGNLVAREERRWSEAAAEAAGATPPYQIFTNEFEALIELQRREWETELGLRAGTIRVKQFFDPELRVGIDLLPEHYRDVDIAPWLADGKEREEFARSRDRWVAEGKFVWFWGKDYYMTNAGEVEST